jgi:hypothetical protein
MLPSPLLLPDPSTVLAVLFSVDFFWIWELCGIFIYFSFQFFRKFQKNKHVIGEFDQAGTFHQMAEFYVSPAESTFKTRAGRGFSTDGMPAYVEATIAGSRNVIFHLFSRARPRVAKMLGLCQDCAEKPIKEMRLLILRDLPKEKSKDGKSTKEADDPSSKEFHSFISGETVKQSVQASTGSVNYGKLLVVMALVIGLAAGAFAIIIGFPHGVFPQSGGVVQTVTTGIQTTTSYCQQANGNVIPC